MKDRCDKGEIKIEHFSTNVMLADYHTKPLQGSLFRKFRDVIMGYKNISWLVSQVPSIKKRVGEKFLINGKVKKG